MKQIILRIGMVAAMLLPFLAVSAYDFEVDGIYYEVTNVSEFTCGVCGVKDKTIDDIKIPSHVSFAGKNLTVTAILEGAFESTDVKNISLPTTCVSIKRDAFSGSKLESINIPESVTSINGAFYGCENLVTVKISDLNAWCNINFYSTTPLSNGKAKLIVNGVELSGTLDTDLYGITSIRDNSFYGYKGITSLILGDSVTSIGELSFCRCSNLNKVVIGPNVEWIGNNAFAECSNLTDLHIADSEQKLEFSGNFNGCNLKQIYIGRDLDINISYGKMAIFAEQEIDSVTIGPKVNQITEYCFNGKVNIKNIRKLNMLPSPKSLDCIFYYENGSEPKSPLKLINPETLILGRNLKAKDTYGYDLNLGLIVEDYCFSDCTDLKIFEIGEYVTDIRDCLRFSRNDSISTIIVKSSVPPVCYNGNGFTKRTYMYCPVKVPVGCEDEYKAAPVWKNFWNIEGQGFSGVNKIHSDEKARFEVISGGIRSLIDGMVEVYSIDGRMVSSCFLANGATLSLSSGFYIVRCGSFSQKVLIR